MRCTMPQPIRQQIQHMRDIFHMWGSDATANLFGLQHSLPRCPPVLRPPAPPVILGDSRRTWDKDIERWERVAEVKQLQKTRKRASCKRRLVEVVLFIVYYRRTNTVAYEISSMR